MRKIHIHVYGSKVQDAERLIQSFTDKGNSVKVYYNPDYEEYVCKLFKQGKHYEPADYFTDDKDDALSSARDMLRRVVDSKDANKRVQWEWDVKVKYPEAKFSAQKNGSGKKVIVAEVAGRNVGIYSEEREVGTVANFSMTA